MGESGVSEHYSDFGLHDTNERSTPDWWTRSLYLHHQLLEERKPTAGSISWETASIGNPSVALTENQLLGGLALTDNLLIVAAVVVAK